MKQEQGRLILLWQIFVTFLRIGPVTFGGGYAMIPLIEREVVEKRGWVRTKDIADILAVAQSVPGAVAINSATFVGYRLAGVLGAIIATIGVLLPTFAIVVLLCLFFLQVKGHPQVEAAFVSIRVTIVAIISYAAWKIGKSAAVDKTTIALIVIGVVLLLFVSIHPVVLIISSAVAGIFIVYVRGRMGMHTKLQTGVDEEYVYEDYYIGDGI